MKRNKANKQRKVAKEMNTAVMSEARPNANAYNWFKRPAYQAHTGK